jgi:hypothetical protein
MPSASGVAPLHLAAISATSGTAAAPAWVAGSTPGHSGIAGSIPLWTAAAIPSGVVPLFVAVSASGSASLATPLWSAGAYQESKRAIPLLLYHGGSGVSAALPFFTQGSGIRPGVTVSGAVPLFVARPETANLPLTLFGPLPAASAVAPLWLAGSSGVTATTPLVTAGIGAASGAAPLYSHGY